MASFSNPSYTDFYQPVSPDRISNLGGAEPPGFVDQIGHAYDYVRAGGEWAYQTGIETADVENTKKVEAAGYKLAPLFRLITEGRNIYAAGSEFQSIMAHNSPIAGPDERYEATTDFQKQVRDAYSHNREILAKAKAERPDLDIKDYQEMNDEVYRGIAAARTPDPRTGWLANMASGIIGGTAAIFSGTNPYAPLEALGLAFGGIGPSTLTRVATAGVVGAGLNVLPQLGGRRTLAEAGVPLSNDDLILSAGLGFAFGAGGQGLSELALGARGRARLNDSYGFMTATKRQEKYEKLYGPVATRGLYEEPPPAPPVVTPRAPIPSGVPEAINRNIPRLAQEANVVLDLHTATLAGKIRFAEDLDHTSKQLEVIGAAPQDFIPPTRSLKDTATVMPSIKTWLGPGIGDAPELPAVWQRQGRTVLDNIGVSEANARKLDPETFRKWDTVNKDLRAAEKELTEVARFHEAAAAKKTDMLDLRVAELNAKVERARSAEGKARAYDELSALMSYHKELTSIRPGGTKPPPIKGYDQIPLGERVATLTAKRDELFQDVERAVARADGLFGHPSAEREAYEEFWRPGAQDRINNPWRWPKGTKRRKGDKTPYEVTWLKGGKSTEQIFAERKLELPQDTSPLAAEGRQPGETQAQTATRVNTLERKTIDEEKADAFTQQVKDMIETLEKEATAPAVKLSPTTIKKVTADWIKDPAMKGWDLSLSGKVIDSTTGRVIGQADASGNLVMWPSMPAGLPIRDLNKLAGFEIDGKAVTLKEAYEDLLGDAEAHAAMTTCSVEP